MLPESWGHVSSVLPHKLGEAILVTVHPDHVAPAVLAPIDLVLAVGEGPERTMKKFADAVAQPLTWPQSLAYERGKVVAWLVGDEQLPFAFEPQPCRAERIRHHRKYAEGNLRYHSFYFRGPDGRLNLRAQNLWMFCQIAEGLDEQTWMFHLRRRDYSRWFRKAIRDEYLAQQTERIELRTDLTWLQSRHLIRELVGARYTLPE